MCLTTYCVHITFDFFLFQLNFHIFISLPMNSLSLVLLYNFYYPNIHWHTFVCMLTYNITQQADFFVLHCITPHMYRKYTYEISGFRREVDENCALRAIKQRVAVIPHRRFGKTCWSHLQNVKNPRSWILGPLKIVQIRCPETSVRNYHYTLCNSPE